LTRINWGIRYILPIRVLMDGLEAGVRCLLT